MSTEELQFTGKKKKKRVKAPSESLLVETESDNYLLLLFRLYEKMGRGLYDPVKVVIEQPLVGPFGKKKTAFLNLLKVCKSMQRDPSHYVKFLETELGTHAFRGAQGRYVMRGRFTTEQVKSVTSNFVRNFVVCFTCWSYATLLKKEGRLLFLLCEQCGSKVSVSY